MANQTNYYRPFKLYNPKKYERKYDLLKRTIPLSHITNNIIGLPEFEMGTFQSCTIKFAT